MDGELPDHIFEICFLNHLLQKFSLFCVRSNNASETRPFEGCAWVGGSEAST